MLVIRMDGWMNVDNNGMVLAHREVEIESELLDIRSSP